jgi:hypothetical protein
MQSFRNPWWPLITTTVPVVILYYIFREAVVLVADQLSATQVTAWTFVAASCAFIGLLHTGYVLWHQVNGHELNRQYGLITVGAYAFFLLIFCCGSSERIPEDVQGSVLGENRLLYAASCLSPTFLHSAIVLVLCHVQKQKSTYGHTFRFSFVICLFLLVALVYGGQSAVGGYAADAGRVIAFIVLHYEAVRWILHVLRKWPWWRQGIGYGFKLAAAVAYPLSGVLVNNDILFDIVFRTFAYPGFYIFTLVNVVVICLPEPSQRHWRMLLFMLRVVTFGFILSMLILNLPLLPQSTMALASFGLGYLMLAPILLAIVKTKMILIDLSFLRLHFSRKSVMMLSLCAVFFCLVLGVSLFQFEDEARSFATAVLHALAFQS